MARALRKHGQRSPQEVASVVVFLCGPGAAYVTNQRIYVSGGTA